MSELRIGDHVIRTGGRAFVIAEIGVNHDGSADRAIELVRHAASAGADAIKLQIFRADALLHSSAAFAQYQQHRVDDADPVAMLRRYELSESAMQAVVDEARRLNLVPLATPFSLADVETIIRLDLPAVKIASPDLVNRPLLKRAARLGRPMLISTGAARLDEVARSVDWCRAWDAPFALLHCVSSYPVPAADTNLCWIGELAKHFHVPTGYSDHTTDPICGALAVMAGACVIEKHLTYDTAAAGPDHSASCDPLEFKAYVASIRSAETLRGVVGKHVLPVERDVRTVSRQSLVFARPMMPGQVVSETDLTIQRPGTGIPASEIESIISRTMKQSASAGDMVRWDMLGVPNDIAA